jgi:hypothetical protein
MCSWPVGLIPVRIRFCLLFWAVSSAIFTSGPNKIGQKNTSLPKRGEVQ